MKLRSILTIALASIAMSQTASALEEPNYEVVHTTDEYEVRRYEPFVVAEVDVEGSRRSAGNQAFRILAGYIFGDNRSNTEMAMTAPVQSQPVKSEKMAMTAPVISSGEQQAYTYAFVMERKYLLDTLPVPNDDRIRIVTRPERYVAVRRFSGRWSEKNFERHEDTLLAALDADGVATLGATEHARYNSPFSLPLMRRNEIMVEIEIP